MSKILHSVLYQHKEALKGEGKEGKGVRLVKGVNRIYLLYNVIECILIILVVIPHSITGRVITFVPPYIYT